MIANSGSALNPDRPIKDKIFATLLKKHFGIEIKTDDSYLTMADYEAFMKSIRLSFAYSLLQKMNTSPGIKAPATDIPRVSRLESTKNYYILDEIYGTLKDNYLHSDTLSDEALIYGAAQ